MTPVMTAKSRAIRSAVAASIVALMLAGCASEPDEPEVIVYPTYPEQHASEEPRWDVTSGADTPPTLYTNTNTGQSADIPNRTDLPATAPDWQNESYIFDFDKPVNGTVTILEITYRSQRPGYFVGVDRNGVQTEAIASFTQPGRMFVVLGAVDGVRATAGIKVFGDNVWEVLAYPPSQLPRFDKSIASEEPMAFVVEGETQNVTILSGGAAFAATSYGYMIRDLGGLVAGGRRIQNSALPGNGAIIVVNYEGEWAIEEAVEVVVEDE